MGTLNREPLDALRGTILNLILVPTVEEMASTMAARAKCDPLLAVLTRGSFEALLGAGVTGHRVLPETGEPIPIVHILEVDNFEWQSDRRHYLARIKLRLPESFTYFEPSSEFDSVTRSGRALINGVTFTSGC